MGGWTSNGVAPVGPGIQNGITLVPPNGLVSQISSRSELSLDTERTNGGSPQTVAAFAANLAFQSVEIALNHGTSTAGAATLNVMGGSITTEALTTAVGAFYTFTLTNSLIAATIPQSSTTTMVNGVTTTTTVAAQNPPILFAIYSGTNTVVGMVPYSVTNNAGSATLVFQNQGTAAMNGTFYIAFHI